MNSAGLEIRPLRDTDESAFHQAIKDNDEEESDFVFAFNFNTNDNFHEYVKLTEKWAQGESLPERFVPNTFLVAVVDGKIVGRVSIRHELNDFLFRLGGHIGYGVVPSERRKGYGAIMLQLALPVARSVGISKVLVTCDDDNDASRKIIEKNGGVFDGLCEDATTRVPKRRYWIDT